MKITMQLDVPDYLASELVALYTALVGDKPIGSRSSHNALPVALSFIWFQIGEYGLDEEDANWDDEQSKFMRWFSQGPKADD